MYIYSPYSVHKITGLQTIQSPYTSTINYTLSNGLVIRETDGTYVIIYTYDYDGTLISFHYDNDQFDTTPGQEYFYIHNLQGDVIKIIDALGQIVIEYHYDGYGNIINDIESNPFYYINHYTYRGYRYDDEIGLFYCNARYYQPTIGRWLNADSVHYLDPMNTNGLNLFAYCMNNPVIRVLWTQGNNRMTGSISVKVTQKTILCSTQGVNNSLFNDSFRFASAQLRTSEGWDTSPTIATSFFGRFGYSSYTTKTQGSDGLFYVFAGSSTDILNWFNTDYYAGVGINIWNVLGVEFLFKTAGIGGSINILSYSFAVDINLIGATSVTIGQTKNIGTGMSRTDGFTIGINTGVLVAIIYGVYCLITTGNSNLEFVYPI